VHRPAHWLDQHDVLIEVLDPAGTQWEVYGVFGGAGQGDGDEAVGPCAGCGAPGEVYGVWEWGRVGEQSPGVVGQAACD
jgi:hypothetical protein